MLMAAVEITSILCYRHFTNRSHVTLTEKISFAIDLGVLKIVSSYAQLFLQGAVFSSVLHREHTLFFLTVPPILLDIFI